MPADYDVRVTPSVFDRLLDHDHTNTRDAPVSRAENLREIREAVLRNLESLLNTRNSVPDLPIAFDRVWQSVLTYGLPDFTTLNPANVADQIRLRQSIAAAISTFEPRLTNVSVQVPETADGARDRLGTLRIQARLRLDSIDEPVAFDVSMPQQTTRYMVKEFT